MSSKKFSPFSVIAGILFIIPIILIIILGVSTGYYSICHILVYLLMAFFACTGKEQFTVIPLGILLVKDIVWSIEYREWLLLAVVCVIYIALICLVLLMRKKKSKYVAWIIAILGGLSVLVANLFPIEEGFDTLILLVYRLRSNLRFLHIFAFVLWGISLAPAKEKIVNQQMYHFSEEPDIDAVEEMKKYKQLLDAGAITTEEFNAKKRELLGL